jgi:hypothetical protein|tara:strand:- start:177 stop:599 length:423 start_codon:yes stop_codon:yes gene_type:complete
VTGVKPTKKDRKKFDIDLQYGTIREEKIIDMFLNKKIEVKSERDTWMKTGNICIEYESYGKPSGIITTEADFWFHNLCIKDDIFCTLVFDVPKLKKLMDKLDFKKSVSGGDHNASRLWLVSIQKLFTSDVYKTFKDLKND